MAKNRLAFSQVVGAPLPQTLVYIYSSDNHYWIGGTLESIVASHDGYVSPGILAFLNWWRSNACSFPISLYLDGLTIRHADRHFRDGEFDRGYRPPADAVKVSEFCTEALPSVRHLELGINREALHALCSSATPTTFERLESLVLRQYFSRGAMSPRAFTLTFPAAPHLRRLHISNYRCTLSFRWEQLTHLWASGLAINSTSQALSAHNHPLFLHFDRISFPNLKALHLIRNFKEESFASLSQFLTLTPALTELHIDAAIFQSTTFSSEYLPETCPLHALLPDLERLVFDKVVCHANPGRAFIRLVESGWTKLEPRNGRLGSVHFRLEPGRAETREYIRVTPEDIASMKESDVVLAIEEYHRRWGKGYNYYLHYPMTYRDGTLF
ncbi:unnamed protein product [Cyclocybe aegerita]|uniref:Uncharacterized protein n=1 Tax=Cyclocybe aegerita TaxID=1973307 RepID=A0A8S0W5B1_CYCAE|nr:unnamed protein product [Cyclocybe aegerita]